MSHSHIAPFRLERWFAEFEFVPGMRNLAASGPFPVTTRELLELEGAETTESYLNLDLDYIENPGSESLRQAVASLYTTLAANDVRIMSGASEALFLLIWSTAEPGQNIVIEDPAMTMFRASHNRWGSKYVGCRYASRMVGNLILSTWPDSLMQRHASFISSIHIIQQVRL